MRFERMSGLDEEQLDELVYRADELHGEPWDKGIGRPRELTLREALVVTCGYLRQHIIGSSKLTGIVLPSGYQACLPGGGVA